MHFFELWKAMVKTHDSFHQYAMWINVEISFPYHSTKDYGKRCSKLSFQRESIPNMENSDKSLFFNGIRLDFQNQ